jgi:glycosyltransferase involved in cell wall biosynthesis
MEFEILISRIKEGNLVRSSELLPYLCLENSEERCRINLRLAEVYSEIGNFQQAKPFIVRSWILSRFSPDILPLFIKIHSNLNDIDSIRDAYKRLGMMESVRGNITEALKYFNLWQYAFANHKKIDKYEYDFDILERIQQMAMPRRFRHYAQSNLCGPRKVRLAYLLFGMSHTKSVLIKINRIFAQYHDRRRFVIAFFVMESCESQEAIENIRIFNEYNCDVIITPGSIKELPNLMEVGRQIYNYKPDILITSALLAEFEHYFVACLHPAPIIVGLLQGPPPQFAAPCLDWCISWSKHPLIDSPCNCSRVNIGLDLPGIDSVTPYAKKDLNISDDSQILLSAGRYVKFQNIEFWKTVLDLISKFPKVYYIAVGVSKEELLFLDELLTPELTERIKLLGWRQDLLSHLCLADVVLDTFPLGGGHVLIEAMALGIPFVSFENDYMKSFDATDWSVADEFVSIPELIVKRGDFDNFKYVVSKLIEDKEYRSKMGERCREEIQLSMGSSERGVRNFESILSDVIERKLNHKPDYFYGKRMIERFNKLLDKCKKWLSKMGII